MTIELALINRIESASAEEQRGTHPYVPHPKYPWFCEQCGYAKHERLQHPAAASLRAGGGV